MAPDAPDAREPDNRRPDRDRRDGSGRPARPPRAAGGRPARSGDGRPPRSSDGRPARTGDARPPRSNDGRPPRTSDGRPPRTQDGRPPRGRFERSDDRRASRPPRDSEERRAKVAEPELPEDLEARELASAARNELKTLSKENAEGVARHLAMAARLIDDDPELAHQHALAASRRAGRIAVVRETVGITAYATGDFALAVRELRTYRRISGRDDQIALLVDSERGVERPDRALEVGRSVDRTTLPVAVRVELAIAMSGARLDLGEPERALQELDIPELDPDRAFEWSPSLFAARATVLEELGREDEAAQWYSRAEIAEEALDAASGAADREVIVVEELGEEGESDGGAVALPTAAEALGVDAEGTQRLEPDEKSRP